MADVAGPTPGDLQGAIEACKEAGDPASMVAAGVYEEALAGKVPLAGLRDTVLVRQLAAGVDLA